MIAVYFGRKFGGLFREEIAMVSVMFVHLTIGGAPVGLVLVFAPTRRQMALRSVA